LLKLYIFKKGNKEDELNKTIFYSYACDCIDLF